jgi:thioredoxin reductase (NADPH)
VTEVLQKDGFEVGTQEGGRYRGRFVIVSTGVVDNYPPITNLYQYIGRTLFTCVDCDGYHTTGKKLLVIGNAIDTVRLAFAMRQMFTKDITLNLIHYDPPPDVKEELDEEGIPLVKGTPVKVIGGKTPEAVELKDGTRIPCEVIMCNFGFKPNDAFLAGLALKKETAGFRYVVSNHYESSLPGLFIVGPLNTGNDQVVIAAGEGAVAAIEINKRLVELYQGFD